MSYLSERVDRKIGSVYTKIELRNSIEKKEDTGMALTKRQLATLRSLKKTSNKMEFANMRKHFPQHSHPRCNNHKESNSGRRQTNIADGEGGISPVHVCGLIQDPTPHPSRPGNTPSHIFHDNPQPDHDRTLAVPALLP